MIDLLGRAGRQDDAQNLMKSMPFEPDATTWGALLGASRIHGNTELGEKAAEMVFQMEPDNAGMYVLLSNLYAASGGWADVGAMRLKVRDTGVKKVSGYSWLEVQNKIHTFSVGDSTHPETVRIYAYLEELDFRLKKEGYISSPKLVLHDVEEEEKEHMLRSWRWHLGSLIYDVNEKQSVVIYPKPKDVTGKITRLFYGITRYSGK